jgi:hypothetical protein
VLLLSKVVGSRVASGLASHSWAAKRAARQQLMQHAAAECAGGCAASWCGGGGGQAAPQEQQGPLVHGECVLRPAAQCVEPACKVMEKSL